MEKLHDTITRIQKMEQCFDEILEGRKANPNIIDEDEEIKEKFQELLVYYENGLWLRDYECDERGEIPTDLKRGILSQDVFYDFLREVNESSIAKSVVKE